MRIRFSSEQLAAINNKGKLLVSASAGSGKTTVMINRITQKMIKERIPLSKMLIVTYTKMAAGDIKEKLARELSELTEKHSGELRLFLLEQMAFLPAAEVCTLHSFCTRLIKRYFYVAAVPPDFDIMDDGEARAEAYEILDKLFAHYIKNEQTFYELYQAFLSNRSDNELKKAIYEKIYLCAIKESEPLKWLENAANCYTDPHKLIQRNIKLLKPKVQRYSQNLDFLQKQAVMLDYKAALSYIVKMREMLDFGLEQQSFSLQTKHLKDEQEKLFVQSMSSLKNDISKFTKAVRTQYLDATGADLPLKYVKILLQLAKDFYFEFSQKKVTAARMQYSDLEHYCSRILQECGDIIRQEYDYVFVDEYQDISPIQDSIINAVAKQDNLFVVGDVKQSIYGFRLSRPQIFLKKQSDLERDEPQNVIRLNKNFRSYRKILDFCNSVFQSLMTPSFGQTDYAADAQLTGGLKSIQQQAQAVESALILKGKKQPQKKPPVYSVLQHDFSDDVLQGIQAEAEYCAQKIDEMLGQQFFDGQQMCSLEPQDFTILLRGKSEIPLFEKALLHYGIPVASMKNQDDTSQSIEIGQLLSLLKLVDNFRQDVPFLTVLKSSIYSFTDEQIFAIRSRFPNEKFYHNCALRYSQEDGSFDNDLFDGSLVLRLRGLFDDLKRYAKMASVFSASDLMAKIIEEKDYFKLVAALKEGDKKQENLESFLARAASDFGKLSLYDFLKNLDKRGVADNDDAIGLSQGRVRIMTIHASKGMEFNVVFLCGMNKGFVATKDDSTGGIIADSKFGLGMDYLNYEQGRFEPSLVSSSFLLAEQMREKEEELRVLYVALTRAKIKLFITASNISLDEIEQAVKNEQNAKSFLPWLWKGLIKEKHTFLQSGDIQKRSIEQTARPLTSIQDHDFIAELDSYIGFQYPYQTDQKPKVSVSELVGEDYCFDAHSFASLDDPDIDAAERGTAYHKIMEHIEFGGDNAASQIKTMLDLAKITNEQAQAVDAKKIDKLLNNPFFAKISDKIFCREKKFILNIPYNSIVGGNNDTQILVQGIIDLYIVDEQGNAVVLDYKTTRADEQALKQTYKKQLDIYAMALEKIGGFNIKQRAIYSFYLDKLVFL